MTGGPDLVKELVQIQEEISRLRDTQKDIGARRLAIQHKLGRLSREVRSRGRMPDHEYRAIVSEQKKLNSRLLDLDREAAPIKSDLRRWHAMEDEVKAKLLLSGPDRSHFSLPGTRSSDVLLQNLIELRQRYLDFASDQTRVSSMRIMAAQFADDLTAALGDKS